MTKLEKRIRRQYRYIFRLMQWSGLDLGAMVRCDYCKAQVFTNATKTVYVTATGERHVCKGISQEVMRLFASDLNKAGNACARGHE